MKKIINNALLNAPLLDDGEIGSVARPTADGSHVLKIRYRTIGDENVLVNYDMITAEAWDWEKAGCKNNDEWRAHLNRMFWAGLSAGLKR